MQFRHPAIKILPIGSFVLLFFYAIQFPYWIQTFLIFFLFIVGGREYGKRALPNECRTLQVLWGTILSIAFTMLLRGFFFYLGIETTNWGMIIPVFITNLIGTVWIILTPTNNHTHKQEKQPPVKIRKREWLIGSLFASANILAFALIAFVAWKSGTTVSIRTPWPLIPSWVLLLIGLQWALLLAGTWIQKRRLITTIQLACTIGSLTVLAPLLYKIGFGFDGFLHIAGERILLETGTLSPKPAYYMGQYVFTTWIAPLLEIDIATIDRWLVPLTAMMLLPLSLLAISKEKTYRTAIISAAIIVPLSPLIATTPHGFATILGICTVILAIGIPNKTIHPILPIVLALWCVLTHPLVGLPILGSIIALTISLHKHIIAKILSILAAIGSGIAVPVIFGLASSIGASGGVRFDHQALFQLSAWKPLVAQWIPWVQNHYALWPEATVWITKILPIIIILLAVRGSIHVLTERQKQGPWLLASFSTWFSACLLSIAGDFGFLIDYERGNYADRLFFIALILLLPLALPELGRRMQRMQNASRISLVAVLISIGMLGAGMSYAALPRHDAATASRGWSVGDSDIEAVYYIDEDSNGSNYTVLANQSVSAAAVHILGFKRYNNDVFFYPIPTGGKLYELFLEASYEEPTRERMKTAAVLGGSKIVYFVVNSYWWKADELIEKARATADRTYVINDGEVTVFRYNIDEIE